MTRYILLPAVAAAMAIAAVGCKKKEEQKPEASQSVPAPGIPVPDATQLAAKGAKVFQEKCAACHAVKGAGGTVGPDLSQVGAKRDALFLQTQLQDPSNYKKDSKMPSFKDMPKEDKDALVSYLLSLK